MAQQRNHQLKVINQFGGGIQNIPADHLIQEDAYSSAINVNTKDSTLRPTRRGLIKSIGYNRTYLAENIDGATKEIIIQSKLSYINYANSLYYVLNDGSSLLKYVDGKSYVKALPTLTNDVLRVIGKGDNASQTFNNEVNNIDPILRNYVADIDASLTQTQKSTTDLYGFFDHSILKDFKTKVRAINDIETPTQATLGTALVSLQQAVNDLVTTTVSMKTKSDGELIDRLIAATTKPAFTQMYAGIENGEKHTIWEAMLYMWMTGDYSRSRQDTAVAGLGKYITEYINTLQSLIDDSAWMFVGQTVQTRWVSDDGTNKNITSSWKSLHDTAEDHIVMAKAVRDRLNTIAGSTPPPASVTDNPQYYIDAINQAIPQSTAMREFVLFAVFMKNRILSYEKVSGYQSVKNGDLADGNTYSNTTLSQMNINMHNFNTLTSTLTTNLEALSIATTGSLDEDFAEYGLVVYDKVVKAYSDMLRSGLVYDKDGVTIFFTAGLQDDHWDEVILYRKAKGDPQFTEVRRFEKALERTDIELKPPFNKGAVPITPYRVKEPPLDFTAMAEYKGSIFLARKDSEELWFTQTGRPDIMNALDFIKVPQPIKTIKSAGAGVFIWTTNDTVYLLTGLVNDGQGNNTLNIKRVADGTPILKGQGATSVDNLVIWISPHGIHNTSGYGSAESTATTWEFTDKPVRCVDSVVAHHKAYFLVEFEDNKQRLIEYDPTTRRVMEHEASYIQSLTVYDDDLYYVDTEDGFDFKLRSFDRGDELVPYKASLKRFAGYSCDVRQRFTNINVCHTAKPYKDIDRDEEMTSLVKVYVDDWLAGEETIVGTNVTRIDLPQTNNTGYSIRVEIEGTLGIKSIRTRYATIDWED